jgi:hypothetical protein
MRSASSPCSPERRPQSQPSSRRPASTGHYEIIIFYLPFDRIKSISILILLIIDWFFSFIRPGVVSQFGKMQWPLSAIPAYASICGPDNESVHPAYNPSFLVCFFFSRNNIFLSQQISRLISPVERSQFGATTDSCVNIEEACKRSASTMLPLSAINLHCSDMYRRR